MKAFFKENFVLALGISLPVILIVLVMAVQSFQKANVQPPQHSILLRHNDYSQYNFRGFNIHVRNEKLHITFREPETTYSHEKDHVIGLMLYNPLNETHEIFILRAPKDKSTTEDLQVELPEKLANLSLSAAQKAPDGTEFGSKRHRNSGFFSDFFVYRSRNHDHLYKDGVPFPLPDMSGRYYSNSFIGWVINHDKDKTTSH